MVRLNPLQIKFRNQQGAITLVLAIILLTSVTLLVIFAADYTMKQQKIATNQFRTQQAYEAAEAGLEFAIPYFEKNNLAILNNQAAGFLLPYQNSNTQNVVLANDGRYTITYHNPIPNNFQLIQITASGTSSDGVANVVINQQIKQSSILIDPPDITLTTKGEVDMGGHAKITNNSLAKTIRSAQQVRLTGSAKTFTLLGESSNASQMGTDIEQYVSSLQNTSESDFFASFFSGTVETIKNHIDLYYQNNQNTNYSSLLDGKTGTSVWIDQTTGTATINGNTTIGSTLYPVLLIVKGNLSIAGNLTLYGLLYEMGGTIDLQGSAIIYGGLVTTGNFDMTGNAEVTFDPTILTQLQQILIYYSKVPGSWRDY